MGDYGKLPVTGAVTMTVLGVTMGVPTMVAIGAGLVVVGIVLLRVSWRRGSRQPQ